MKALPTALPGVLLFEPAAFADARGWFMETFSAPRFAAALAEHGHAGPVPAFVQDNQSCSHRGVLRGLHYQLSPSAQGKLVQVTRGAAWDVAVDVRRGSPTFGRWFGTELNAANRRQLWIPPGFAHGFLALQDDTLLQYKVTALYARERERGIRPDDPELAIGWPELGRGGDWNVSGKDAEAPLLADAELPSWEG